MRLPEIDGAFPGRLRLRAVREDVMKYIKGLAILGALLLTVGTSSAQVRVAVGVGPAVVGSAHPVYGPPVCPYGYYSYYPYACAPYGYYGPDWFVGGVFIGAGPWYHAYYGHRFYDRGFYGRGYGWGHGYYRHPGYYGRGYGYGGHSYRGYGGGHGYGSGHGLGGGFHGGGGFRGGSGFHGARR
jgi:hypothetical protein